MYILLHSKFKISNFVIYILSYFIYLNYHEYICDVMVILNLLEREKPNSDKMSNVYHFNLCEMATLKTYSIVYE